MKPISVMESSKCRKEQRGGDGAPLAVPFLAEGFSFQQDLLFGVIKAAGMTWLGILLIIALLAPNADP